MKRFLSTPIGLTVLVAVMLLAMHLVSPLAGLCAVPVMFGMAFSPQATSEIGRLLAAWGFGDPSGGRLFPAMIPKTADYVMTSPLAATGGDPSGTAYSNRGAAGAVTFTLPAVIPALAGVFYDFYGVADQVFTVAAAAGKVVTFNNAAATSVACSTAGQKIGAHIRATCDGTSWHLVGDRIGVTYTVA